MREVLFYPNSTAFQLAVIHLAEMTVDILQRIISVFKGREKLLIDLYILPDRRGNHLIVMEAGDLGVILVSADGDTGNEGRPDAFDIA